MAGDIGNDRGPEAFHERQFGDDEGFKSGVLQSDTVEKAAGGLGHPGRIITQAWIQGQALGADRAQLGQVIPLLHFPAEAKGAGGCYHRVFQGQRSDLDRQVHHTTASAGKTGPSTQQR